MFLDKIPPMKIPKLKILRTELLSHPQKLINRMTCNLFSNQLHNHTTSTGGPPSPSTSPPFAHPAASCGNILERRTIQSTHISTISSLVDSSKASNKQCHDSQRDNYGLYALKCNRSAAKRTGILMNITTNELSASNQCHYEIKHEHFEPCQSFDSDLSSLNYAMENREYYKIEFSEEGGLRSSHHSRQASRNVHADDGMKKAVVEEVKFSNAYECSGNNDGRNKISDVRPRRTAPIPPNRVRNYTPEMTVKNYSSPSASESSGSLEPLPAVIQHRSADRKSHNQQPIVSNASVESSNSVKCVDGVVTKKSTEIPTHPMVASLPKPRFQLFRSTKSENLAESPIPKTTRVALASIKRESSSDDSVNIFRPDNTSNAFDDFDEIFFDEPVHVVQAVDSINNNIPNRGSRPPMKKLSLPGKNANELNRYSTSASSTIDRSKVDQKDVANASGHDICVNNSNPSSKRNNNEDMTHSDTLIKSSKTDELHRNDDYDYYNIKSVDQQTDISINNESKLSSQPPKRYITTEITV